MIHSRHTRTKETADAFILSLARLQRHNDVPDNNFIAEKFPMTINSTVNCIIRKANQFKWEGPTMDELARSEAAWALLAQFNERYGLEGNAQATLKDLLTLQQIAAFEASQQLDSPWCKIFTVAELELIEHLNDIHDYYAQFMPGRDFAGNAVMTHLFRRLDSIVRRHRVSEDIPPRALLIFTHESLLKRLASYHGFYPPLDKTPTIPVDRPIRTSTAMPFSANFTVVLYRCTIESKYKLMSLWNEVPINIRGCSGKLCDYEEFANFYGNLCPTKPS